MARGKHEASKKSEKTKPEKKPKRSGGAKKAVLMIAGLRLLSSGRPRRRIPRRAFG